MNALNLLTPTQVGLSMPVEEPSGTYEMSHLINAALVDKEFCNLLLTEPQTALAQGCYGETFKLNPPDRQFVLTACAASLADFAERWLRFANS